MYWISRSPSVEQPYWERSGEDYIAHRERTPVVGSAVYRYPNSRIMIKEERIVSEEQRSMPGNWYKCSFPSGNQHAYRAPEAQKKVHFAELDRKTEVGRNEKYEVTEEKVENRDDSFIQRNHNNNMYGNQYKYNFPIGYRHGSPAPEAQKKAHFVESEKTTEVERKGKHTTEEKVDNEADSFIKRKHKAFELAKMDTFKVYPAYD